jgi:carbon storage regulator CsrA
MLVLSRKPGESIQIDENIRVVVVSVSNGRVKLGFEAPDHIRIQRSELPRCKTDSFGRERVAGATHKRVTPCLPR